MLPHIIAERNAHNVGFIKPEPGREFGHGIFQSLIATGPHVCRLLRHVDFVAHKSTMWQLFNLTCRAAMCYT